MHKIRQELNQIRYYYSRRELFDKAFGCVGKSGIVDLVEKYNKAVCNAEPRLYEIYVSIYIEGCTQENAADQLGYWQRECELMRSQWDNILQNAGIR